MTDDMQDAEAGPEDAKRNVTKKKKEKKCHECRPLKDADRRRSPYPQRTNGPREEW